MLRCGHRGNGFVKHAAQCDAVDICSVDAKADDAPSKLVHDDEHPVALQQNRFTPKQVDAPKAVLGVADKGQP